LLSVLQTHCITGNACHKERINIYLHKLTCFCNHATIVPNDNKLPLNRMRVGVDCRNPAHSGVGNEQRIPISQWKQIIWDLGFKIPSTHIFTALRYRVTGLTGFNKLSAFVFTIQGRPVNSAQIPSVLFEHTLAASYKIKHLRLVTVTA